MGEQETPTCEIRYLKSAQKDLTDIVEYIQEDSPSAALSVIEKIDKSISNLELNPLLGVIPQDPRLEKLGYRMLIVEKYIVFYKFKGNLVRIYRILHGARRYHFLL